MIVHATKPLFAWDELQSSPTLGTIRQALEAIPDALLLAALQARRHNGCDTYPVRVLWGVLLLSILLRHATTEACLEELRRNAPLRLLVGIESEDAVPHGWNMTRFLAVLSQPTHLHLMRDIFNHLVQRLGVAVPDLGRHGEVADGLPQASGGRKEYTNNDGTATKVVEWLGYKLHLLVDVKHEVALAFDITDTKAGDNERIEALVEQAERNLPAA